MSAGLVALSDEQAMLAGELDVLAESGLACRNMKAGFGKAMLTAVCVERLKRALDDRVMQPIMALQGSSLGFRTDKDGNGRCGYPVDAVREALIAAVMAGLMPCGNHFNIISGRMYVTKEGFTYLLDQAGVKYTIDQAVPVMKNGGAIVATDVTWTDAEGHKGCKHLDVPVRVNAGMGADAILGKGERKAKCWLYNNLLHAQLADGEAEAGGDKPWRDVTPSRKAQAPAFLGGESGDGLPGLEEQEVPGFGKEVCHD